MAQDINQRIFPFTHCTRDDVLLPHVHDCAEVSDAHARTVGAAVATGEREASLGEVYDSSSVAVIVLEVMQSCMSGY